MCSDTLEVFTWDLRAGHNNNNNNNNHDDIYSAVIYGFSHMREFTVVHLGQSRSAPGGEGQAANLTFESTCMYRLMLLGRAAPVVNARLPLTEAYVRGLRGLRPRPRTVIDNTAIV